MATTIARDIGRMNWLPSSIPIELTKVPTSEKNISNALQLLKVRL
jgi:hypothetical protein